MNHIFTQLCLFHYAEIHKDYILGVWSINHQTKEIGGIGTTKKTKMVHKAKKVQPSSTREERQIGQIAIDNKQQPICRPRYLTITKILNDLKVEALSVSCMVQLIVEKDIEEIKGVLSYVLDFNQISPIDLTEEQC